jgi:hypothetical protein
MTQESIQATVDFVLTSNNLPVTKEARERLIASYPLMREMAESLRIPDVRYGDPAIVYPASITR